VTQYFECRIPAELVTEDWQECATFRFVKIDEDTVELEVTRDLDLLTAPEAA
jgi:hypothetical protein